MGKHFTSDHQPVISTGRQSLILLPTVHKSHDKHLGYWAPGTLKQIMLCSEGPPSWNSWGWLWLVLTPRTLVHTSVWLSSQSNSLEIPCVSVHVHVCVSEGVWTWDLMIANQALYHLSHTPALFCFSYFLHQVSHFSSGDSLRPWSSYLCLPCNWDCRLCRLSAILSFFGLRGIAIIKNVS
jgi:hypothetical protein